VDDVLYIIICIKFTDKAAKGYLSEAVKTAAVLCIYELQALVKLPDKCCSNNVCGPIVNLKLFTDSPINAFGIVIRTKKVYKYNDKRVKKEKPQYFPMCIKIRDKYCKTDCS